jgi:hypothetical protein
MSLFAEFIKKPATSDNKKAACWSELDMKENLSVIIKEAKEPELDRVSVTLGGLIPVKVIDNQASFKIKKGSLTREEVLEQVKGLDDAELFPLLRDAHKRLLTSLHKSKLAKAAKLAKAKKRKKQEEYLLIAQKQEKELKIAVSLNKLKEEKASAEL